MSINSTTIIMFFFKKKYIFNAPFSDPSKPFHLIKLKILWLVHIYFIVKDAINTFGMLQISAWLGWCHNFPNPNWNTESGLVKTHHNPKPIKEA